MRFGSLFDGISGFVVAFERAGMECRWRSEIDKFCNELVGEKYLSMRNIGDVRNVTKETAESVDVICGGFPCQDLSVAGRRKGLAGERSGLWFEFLRVITELGPKWVVIENVPGLLSSNGGRDFAILLRGLVKLRYGVAWRVLDAQYFGVAQHRRRVFIVGSLGNGRAAQVLFERESLSGNTPPSRKAGKGITPTVAKGINFSGLRGRQPGSAASLIGISLPLNSRNNRKNVDQTLIAFAQNTRDEVRLQGGDGKITGAVQAQPGTKQQTYIAFTARDNGRDATKDLAPTMRSLSYRNSHQPGSSGLVIAHQYGVRRLTPLECERLQGFPDDWTAGQSDTQRYKQLGNAVAVPVVQWIGERIMEVSK